MILFLLMTCLKIISADMDYPIFKQCVERPLATTFMIHNAKTIESDKFSETINLIVEIINMLTSRPNNIVNIITFSDSAKFLLPSGRRNTIPALLKMKQRGEGLDIIGAFLLLNKSFSESTDEKTKLGILIIHEDICSDWSFNSNSTNLVPSFDVCAFMEEKLLSIRSVPIIAIGVGLATKEKLLLVTGNPNSTLIFPTLNDVASSLLLVLDKICDANNAPSLPKRDCTRYDRSTDITLIIPNSKFIGKQNFKQLEQFVEEMALIAYKGWSFQHLILFSREAIIKPYGFRLSLPKYIAYLQSVMVLSEHDEMDIGKAMRSARKFISVSNRNKYFKSRYDVTQQLQIVFLYGDLKQNQEEDVLFHARLSRFYGIYTLVVGIKTLNVKFLRQIASSNDFTFSTFSILNVLPTVLGNLCTEKLSTKIKDCERTPFYNTVVLNNAASITPTEMKAVHSFIKTFLHQLTTIRFPGKEMGVFFKTSTNLITFTNSSQILVNSSRLTLLSKTYSTIDGIRPHPVGIQSNLKTVLRGLMHLIPYFSSNAMVVIIPSSASVNDILEARGEAAMLRMRGVPFNLLVIGTTRHNQWQSLTQNPETVFVIPDFKSLQSYCLPVLRTVCSECGLEWNFFGNSCYQLYIQKETVFYASFISKSEHINSSWSEAAAFKPLLSINNKHEEEFVRTTFNLDELAAKNLSIFIGLSKTSVRNSQLKGRFQWEDGSPVIYTAWDNTTDPPQPDGGSFETCSFWRLGHGWHDVGCGELLPSNFISEIPITFRDLQFPKKSPILTPVSNMHLYENNLNNTVVCTSGELVSKSVVCDGIQNCVSGSDELNCDSVCMNTQFTCNSDGSCISRDFFCDGNKDCMDGSDEFESCKYMRRYPENVYCENGQFKWSGDACDGVWDCNDRSDEAWSFYCGCRYSGRFLCQDGTCIPNHWLEDGVIDCYNGEDERGNSIRKYNHMMDIYKSWIVANGNSTKCLLIVDKHGKEMGNVFEYHCMLYECPEGLYKCPGSYCILTTHVCDGIAQCPDGADEISCETYQCPTYFKCRNSQICVHPSEICDGRGQCPLSDDELLCQFKCPSRCQCQGSAIYCTDVHLSGKISDLVTALYLTNVSLPDSFNMLFAFHLTELNITRSNFSIFNTLQALNLISVSITLTDMSDLPGTLFYSVKHVKHLNLTENNIMKIDHDVFKHNSKLLSLTLSNNPLRHLAPYTFEHLIQLESLDLSHCQLEHLPLNTFVGLKSLRFLDISYNRMESFQKVVLKQLTSLSALNTDIFMLCCPNVRPRTVADDNCISPQHSVSSCAHLMQRDVLRVFVWIIGVFACIGNVIAIIYRIGFDRSSLQKGYGVLLVNLGVSDFLMGVYMIILGIADVIFRGSYVWHENTWKNSITCQTAGVIATLSCEASVLFICHITFDRFVVLQFPFSRTLANKKYAWIFCLVVWTLASLLAMIPHIPPLSDWNIYSNSGVCLSIPLMGTDQPGWAYTTGVFIVLNLVLFILIALGQVLIYRAISRPTIIRKTQPDGRESKVARKLALIVITDFCCWFPVGVMGVMALTGTRFSSETYAWTAVFILPINSALNPILYTIPAVIQRSRQIHTYVS